MKKIVGPLSPDRFLKQMYAAQTNWEIIFAQEASDDGTEHMKRRVTRCESTRNTEMKITTFSRSFHFPTDHIEQTDIYTIEIRSSEEKTGANNLILRLEEQKTRDRYLRGENRRQIKSERLQETANLN